MLLNMLVDKIHWTGIELIKFHLQVLIMLDFRWNSYIIRAIENLLRSQGCTQWVHPWFPGTPSLSY